MSVTLYHGSKSGIVGPISPSSRSTCDFGRAFYMGESTHQPLTLVCHAAEPKLYTLEFDDSDLRTLDVGSDLLWALFVAFNRGEMSAYAETPLVQRLAAMTAGVDVLRGRIANDRRTDGIYFDELCEKYRSGEGLPTC